MVEREAQLAEMLPLLSPAPVPDIDFFHGIVCFQSFWSIPVFRHGPGRGGIRLSYRQEGEMSRDDPCRESPDKIQG